MSVAQESTVSQIPVIVIKYQYLLPNICYNVLFDITAIITNIQTFYEKLVI